MTINRPLMDDPQVVFEELMEEIKHAILNQPRTLQTEIGPSEYGDPCDRALIQRLAGIPQPGEADKVNWRAAVGTWMHDGLETIFRGSIQRDRFLLEKRVTVGTYNGQTLAGSCDIYDTATGIVWDWKSKSATRLKEAKRHGPTMTYRRQMHGYGRGYQLLGYDVRHVGNIYLPRDGEYRDICFYSEPYDETIVTEALERCATFDQLIETFGVETTLAMYPECDSDDCYYCDTHPRPLGNKTMTPDNPFGLDLKGTK